MKNDMVEFYILATVGVGLIVMTILFYVAGFIEAIR